MITIYGSPQSSAGRCYWTLEEAGAPWEQAPFSMRNKDHKSAEFLKLNPNGKVPCIRDGSATLWESTAINFYIAEKWKQNLLGTTALERALVQQWSTWSQVDLQPPLIQVFIQLHFIPEERRNQEVIDTNLEKVKPLLVILDQELNHKKYLAGEEFTLADINVASVASVYKSLGFSLDGLNNLQKWLETCQSRPAWKKVSQLDS